MEVTTKVTAEHNVTEKIESIFDENNTNTNTSTHITVGDGIIKTVDRDSILIQKLNKDEVVLQNPLKASVNLYLYCAAPTESKEHRLTLLKILSGFILISVSISITIFQ